MYSIVSREAGHRVQSRHVRLNGDEDYGRIRLAGRRIQPHVVYAKPAATTTHKTRQSHERSPIDEGSKCTSDPIPAFEVPGGNTIVKASLMIFCAKLMQIQALARLCLTSLPSAVVVSFLAPVVWLCCWLSATGRLYLSTYVLRNRRPLSGSGGGTCISLTET